ncbi:dihydrolipoyl dehydrogenase [Halalkalibacter alkalisediminis]|uniref:Dihydrolipoyl dehydrogenase n=1 Tax=Halalkalibacter alkalisediminis TaxID=935616 RepID=A0ABV6NKZ3_9BACI|nr:dihydrolipoyl dehydrogenase [Halalkalibacter alkalisediminis]
MSRIAIIGGGPGGYVAAITAAQKGKEVILIDQGSLGGTCLNEGCMPTKALLESAAVAEKVKNAEHYGVNLPTGEVQIDWERVQAHKQSIVNNLVSGVGYLMKKNKITVRKGQASFLSEHKIQVNGGVIEADQFIIATGSEPIALPFAPFDGNWIINSTQAMSLPSIPSSLLIVGGGVIGCEFASIYSRMGTKVTIVEMADQLLPGEDPDVVNVLVEELENAGVEIFTGSTLKGLNSTTRLATFENREGTHERSPEVALISIGRRPRTANLNLEKIGVLFSKQGIHVNESMQTNIPHIYACGDVTGGIQLAHVAFHEGTIAALNGCGEEASVNYRAVPRCIYTSPEIASVGLTEKQARNQYGDIRIGEFPFMANGKAMIENESIGKVKVLLEPEFNEMIGVSIVGPHATELIGQGTIMLHSEMTVEIMEHFIAAHPTLSEAVHEAILSASGKALHS